MNRIDTDQNVVTPQLHGQFRKNARRGGLPIPGWDLVAMFELTDRHDAQKRSWVKMDEVQKAAITLPRDPQQQFQVKFASHENPTDSESRVTSSTPAQATYRPKDPARRPIQSDGYDLQITT